VSVDADLVPEVTESLRSRADSTSGRQIYIGSRDNRRRNFAGLLTVALCALVAFYTARTFSPIGNVSHNEASDAGVVMEEMKASNGSTVKDVVKSAKAKVDALKAKLAKAVAQVKKLASNTTTTAKVESKETTTTVVKQKRTTTTQKATITSQKATTVERKTTTAEEKATTTEKKATTAKEKATTTEQKATTAEQTTATSEKKSDTTIAKDEGKDKKGDAKKPDPSFGWPAEVYWPRLFCWSVMNKDNPQEVSTMKMQVKLHIGISSCERFAVLSGVRMYLGEGHKWKNGTAVKVYSWRNPAKAVPMGNLQAGDETNSFKNTEIFINAWNILLSSKIMEGDIDWIIKADPDAVFFPERLRKHVKPFSWGKQTKTPMYFKNCNYKGPKLYGALEVFNQAAMLKLNKHMAWCTGLPWGGWGEDEFIDKCMIRLSAKALQDYKLVGDHRCMSAECEATDRASFHDYKSPELYQNCWNRSKNSEKYIKKMAQGHFFCCTSPGNHADPCNTCNPGASTKPNQGWCGSSKRQCKGCGGGSEWCKFDKKKKKNVAA